MRPVILDVDTGSDDAIALMLAAASEELKILGICTVAGNKPLAFTTRNTIRVLDVLGRSDRVYPGCPEAMVRGLNPNRKKVRLTERRTADPLGKPLIIHSDDILQVEPSRAPEQTNAVQFYIDCLSHAEEPITLILLGPQTNLAMALRIRPEITKNIDSIIMMGGGWKRSNVTIAAEFNIYQDPEAAQIVAESGCRLLYVPLDATFSACFREQEINAMRQCGTRAGEFAAELAAQILHAYRYSQFTAGEVPAVPLHDALAVACAVDPDIMIEKIFTRVDIDFSGGYGDGQTLIDTRVHTDKPKNAWVALRADAPRFRSLLLQSLAKLL